MVAYVPVPFAQLAEVVGQNEDFLLSDQERINLAHVHTKLMQLAEVYLAYNVVTSSSVERPRLVLLDMLPSSAMASIAGSAASVNLSGYRFDRRRLDFRDIVVATAHPFAEALGLPNRNRFRLHQLIIGELHRTRQKTIDLQELAKRHGLATDDLVSAARGQPLYGDTDRYREVPGGLIGEMGELPRAQRLGILNGTVFTTDFETAFGEHVSLDVGESWQFTVDLFRSICDRLFRQKEPDAMIYNVEDHEGRVREHWLDPTDIDFLTAVGIRALAEACWKQDVMLIGIAKDSASRYFTRNYLGVLCHAIGVEGLTGLEVGKLPWTDRMFFEFIAELVSDLGAPWATCEFDSAFMTLWMAAVGRGPNPDQLKLGAVQDHIVAHLGLFDRSLAQFFVSRAKANPLMGHMIFVDRLLHPDLDGDAPRLDLRSAVLEQRGIASHSLGEVQPVGYPDADRDNAGQDIAMYLLSCLTRNHYPEVIGYPDPLHKADWGAKTLGDRLRATIRSSEVAFRGRPLSRTLRTIRDSYRRR